MSDSLKGKKQQSKFSLVAIQSALSGTAVAGTALSTANYGSIVQARLQERAAPSDMSGEEEKLGFHLRKTVGGLAELNGINQNMSPK